MKPSQDTSGLMLSILAYDPADHALGIALASSSVAIGSRCPHLAAGKAVVASQGFTNLKVGPLALDLVECGLTGPEVMGALRQHDRWMDYRQIAIVAAGGEVVAHTGEKTKGWAGQAVGPGLVCLGNGLPDAFPLEAMRGCFAGLAGAPLAERLLQTLEHGRDVVGRRRAMVSSALLVRAPLAQGLGTVAPIDLRIDLVREPPEAGGCAVADLRRLHDRYRPLADYYVQRSMAPHPA